MRKLPGRGFCRNRERSGADRTQIADMYRQTLRGENRTPAAKAVPCIETRNTPPDLKRSGRSASRGSIPAQPAGRAERPVNLRGGSALTDIDAVTSAKRGSDPNTRPREIPGGCFVFSNAVVVPRFLHIFVYILAALCFVSVLIEQESAVFRIFARLFRIALFLVFRNSRNFCRPFCLAHSFFFSGSVS